MRRTFVNAVSSVAGVVFGNTTSANVMSNGCRGTNTFLNAVRAPRRFGLPRMFPRTIVLCSIQELIKVIKYKCVGLRVV